MKHFNAIYYNLPMTAENEESIDNYKTANFKFDIAETEEERNCILEYANKSSYPISAREERYLDLLRISLKETQGFVERF